MSERRENSGKLKIENGKLKMSERRENSGKLKMSERRENSGKLKMEKWKVDS